MSLQIVVDSIESLLQQKLNPLPLISPLILKSRFEINRRSNCNNNYLCIEYDVIRRIAYKPPGYTCECFLFKCSFCKYTTWGITLAQDKKDLCVNCDAIIRFGETHNMNLSKEGRCTSCFMPLGKAPVRLTQKHSSCEWLRTHKHELCWKEEYKYNADCARMQYPLTEEEIELIYRS